MKKSPFYFVIALVLTFWHCGSAHGQNLIRDYISERLQSNGAGESALISPGTKTNSRAEKISLEGLDVAVWRPTSAVAPYPLVIFSHGFHGINTQSEFIMEAMARDGYLVVSPKHKDAGFSSRGPQVSFSTPEKWNESTYKDRCADITSLIAALHADSKFDKLIDWSKVALAGHSLGGFTALALAGAWPSWKIADVKAVLALSPYTQPLTASGNLSKLNVPVMYQGGTRDYFVTPFIKKAGGAFEKTSTPVYFVEFNGIGHFGWTNFNHSASEKDLINYYCLAFLDKYLKGDDGARLDLKLDGVSVLNHRD